MNQVKNTRDGVSTPALAASARTHAASLSHSQQKCYALRPRIPSAQASTDLIHVVASASLPTRTTSQPGPSQPAAQLDMPVDEHEHEHDEDSGLEQSFYGKYPPPVLAPPTSSASADTEDERERYLLRLLTRNRAEGMSAMLSRLAMLIGDNAPPNIAIRPGLSACFTEFEWHDIMDSLRRAENVTVKCMRAAARRSYEQRQLRRRIQDQRRQERRRLQERRRGGGIRKK